VTARPVVCVVGAGSSGIAVCKALFERGIPYDCFERGAQVGGLWRYGQEGSAAYRTLHINTSRDRMQYADFPMPRDYPDFPHHSQVAAYFDAYVDHFGFRHTITFGTTVERCEREPGGGWRVRLGDGTERRYDALAVANGHHWDPRWPDPPFPGVFAGREMHAHDFRDASAFRDLDVVVVGMGNSAMDIACEASSVARRVVLSSRRGAWIVPKYVFGRPLDAWPLPPQIPFAARQALIRALYRVAVGRMERYGLPRPDHRLLAAHPTISDTILSRLTHGVVTHKPNIAARDGDRVRFTDGSEVRADVIVYCTGYNVTFPFFDPAFVSAPDNDLPLFRRVFKPGLPDLFFVGLLQPLGAIMPLAEAQGRWIAEYLEGGYALPAPEDMDADIERERRAMRRRYVASPRHTMQVDFDDYLWHLEREIRRGRKRAARRGRPPVPARSDYAPAWTRRDG
jgi:hypothetical protein